MCNGPMLAREGKALMEGLPKEAFDLLKPRVRL
jgi:hypothetical protein